jgi:predicted DNA-binding transcriptional regulator YafY
MGGLYLLAYVPEYEEIRTFAVERIQEISLLDDRFVPVEELPGTAFPDSLGVHSGPPEPVDIEFEAAVADYVRSRTWHQTQVLRELPAGRVAMALQVCVDRALKSWILSFGPFARVVSPGPLAREIARQLEDALKQYAQAGSVGEAGQAIRS